jgi:hypothetical protein
MFFLSFCLSLFNSHSNNWTERMFVEHRMEVLGLNSFRICINSPFFSLSLLLPDHMNIACEMRSLRQGKTARLHPKCWTVDHKQCTHLRHLHQATVRIVLPLEGSYTLILRSLRLVSGVPLFDDLLHFRVTTSTGLTNLRSGKEWETQGNMRRSERKAQDASKHILAR